ncbi:MAG TPA: serine/threonine-protein kinase [Verrucomicrobiae bacterium]|nr:serine/threonine-protein kinase [Verrucomicrobiae bacterium]
MGTEQQESEQDDQLLGTRLGGYEIERLIGRGAMGNVYRARQISLDRAVAIKLLIPYLASQPELLARFFREAKAAASISHANLVQVYDFGEADGTYFYVMELIEGLSLGEYLRRGEKFGESECLGICRQAVAALQAAHKSGIIHRDVKPDNLMLSQVGQIKLSDLGLARVMDFENDKSLTMTGVSIGTPFYISPEQVRGERDMDHRTDFYGLGATLFHLATGQVPFEGETSAVVMARHMHDPIPWARDINPTLSDGFSAFLHRLMAKSPSERPASHEEILAELDQCELGQAASSPRPGGGISTKVGTDVPVSRRGMGWLWRAVGAAAAVGVLAVVGLGAWFLIRLATQPSSQSTWAAVARTTPADTAPVGVHPLTLDEGPQIKAIFENRHKMAAQDGLEVRVPFDPRGLKREWLRGGTDDEPALREDNGIWLHWDLADLRKAFEKLPEGMGAGWYKTLLPQVLLQRAQLVLVFRAITAPGQLEVFFSSGKPTVDLPNEESVVIVKVEPGRAQVVSLNITDRFKSILMEQTEGSWLVRFTPKEGHRGSAVLAEVAATDRLLGPRIEVFMLNPQNRERSGWWLFRRGPGGTRPDSPKRMAPPGAGSMKPPKGDQSPGGRKGGDGRLGPERQGGAAGTTSGGESRPPKEPKP